MHVAMHTANLDLQYCNLKWYEIKIFGSRSFQERWSEVTRRIELHVSIKEMNDNGQYASVEVRPSSDVLTGGIYQLKQVNCKLIII